MAEKHEYLNSFINDSNTITERAGAALAAPAHKAAMYGNGGGVLIATSAEKAIGIILSAGPDPIEEGAPVHILISRIGLLEAAGPIAKGDLVSINASGQGTVAESGGRAFGRAFTAAAAAGECIQVQLYGL